MLRGGFRITITGAVHGHRRCAGSHLGSEHSEPAVAGAASAAPPLPLGKDELLREMDAADVARAVIVPPSWEGERNDLALAAARTNPERFAMMGRLDTESAGARESVKDWRQQPGMLGLRFTFHRPNLMAPLTAGAA
jgi:L-fuconolactonase